MWYNKGSWLFEVDRRDMMCEKMWVMQDKGDQEKTKSDRSLIEDNYGK